MSEQQPVNPLETPLHDAERALGATFKEYAGWLMADRYSQWIQEYNNTRSNVGLADLSYYGAVRIGGKESIQFLNGLVTNDVKTLEKGKGVRAGFLTGHGKVRAISRILGLGNKEFLLINDPQTHEKILRYITPFSYAGDFNVQDVSDRYRIVSVLGQKALLVMKEICFEPLPQMNEFDWIETIIAGRKVLVVRASRSCETGFDILVEQSGLEDVWDFVMLKGGFHQISPVGLQALDALRIEAGIPVYGVDVDETNMMLETGLTDAISYTKGCYTGQEAVAMATYRGHVSKKLSGLAISEMTVPPSGSRIIKNEKEIGYLTSAINSPSLGSVIALGYIKYGFFDIGTTVEVKTEEGSLSATIIKLPFCENAPR